MKERAGLYIHFPFCAAKCSYCHFASQPWTPSAFRNWRECLEREVALPMEPGLVFDTIYLGGGTPSLLEPGDIAWLLELARSPFSLEVDEFTLEANPGAGGADRMRGWREAGVTRLSVGVQSFDDAVLATLGRPYAAAEALNFCRAGRAAGFETLAIDLMIGVPGETPASVGRSFEIALGLEPDHVSVYFLENVEGLPFEAVLARHPIDEDAVVDAYGRIRDTLEAAGLRQYEISNFARPGRECRHNLKYWRYETFVGLGPSACSNAGGRRWCNKTSLDDWAEALRRNDTIREDVVELTAELAAREALVFGLRTVAGVDLAGFTERFNVDVMALFGREMGRLVEEGWLIREAGRLRIPADKFPISNAILSRFV
ncbi:MAG: radical SAM family heme chaperone HemW [Candidatus Aminicenantes bacterium]|nr:radical SAM family heme chaperone HemW [Candidatus Aminicenantes bacterium]